jgi:hypothetical protein
MPDNAWLKHEHLTALTTGTLYSRVYALLEVLGLRSLAFKVSLRLHPDLLPACTADRPTNRSLRFTHHDERQWQESYVLRVDWQGESAVCPADLAEEPFRKWFLAPAFDPLVQMHANEKAVVEVLWSMNTRPVVTAAGTAYEAIPPVGFDTAGTRFSVDIPDQALATPSAAAARNFELPAGLALEYWRKPLPEECHNVMIAEALTHHGDLFLRKYLKFEGDYRARSSGAADP